MTRIASLPALPNGGSQEKAIAEYLKGLGVKHNFIAAELGISRANTVTVLLN